MNRKSAPVLLSILCAACLLLGVANPSRAQDAAAPAPAAPPAPTEFTFTYQTPTALPAGLFAYTTLGNPGAAASWKLVSGSAVLELFYSRPGTSNARADIYNGLFDDDHYLMGIGAGGYTKLSGINFDNAAKGLYFDLKTDATKSGLTLMQATFSYSATPTPVPAAVWLLGSGLVGLVGLRRKLS